MRSLVISVRFDDGRYHGRPDWPPSPARLFQALVAGAANGEMLAIANRSALAWLELLEAPVIAAPAMRLGQGFTNYVPNNDRDTVEFKKFKNHRDYLAALGKIRFAQKNSFTRSCSTRKYLCYTFGRSPMGLRRRGMPNAFARSRNASIN